MQTRTSREDGYRGACPRVGESTPGQDDEHEAAMTEKPEPCGRRQARGRRPASRAAAARCGVAVALIALILIGNTDSAMGSPGVVGSPTGAGAGAGNGAAALLAPLRQATTDAAPEPPSSTGATSEARRLAAVVAVVNRQGTQGPEILRRVSAVAVPNLMTMPVLVVDARAKRAVDADAAAAEIALTVQATVEAQEAEAASKAAALAATQGAEADAAASATAAAAEAAAMMSAKQEARVHAAEVVATRNAKPVVAAVASNRVLPDRMSSLLIALTPMLGGVLGLRLWRGRKEPFVLKANPTPARSGAPA